MRLRVYPNDIDTSKIQVTKLDDSISVDSGKDIYGNDVNLYEAVDIFNMKVYSDKEKKQEVRSQVEKSILQEN